MTDFDSILKKATLPTKTVSLCLAGELVEEHAQLEAQLAAAPSPTNLGDGTRRILAEQILAVEEQMREDTVDFHLRALPSRPWALFYASQPTRKEGESDEDFEPRAFAWAADLVSRTCVDPVMTVDQVGELVDVIHARPWSELQSACYVLNLGEIDIPNSNAASDLIGNSEQT